MRRVAYMWSVISSAGGGTGFLGGLPLTLRLTIGSSVRGMLI